MRLFLIADGLNASAQSVSAAMMAGDADWLRQRARRYEGAGCDALDVCAASMGSAEGQVLEWALQTVEPFVGIPVCIDSGDLRILTDALRHRNRSAVVNGLDASGDWPDVLLDLAIERGAMVVVQARKGDVIARSRADRVGWLQTATERLVERGMDPGRLLLDPVALPWGDDWNAGRDYLEAVADLAGTGSPARVLGAISNLSWGHPNRSDLNRRWLQVLREYGLGAALLDAADSGLMELARRETS